MKKKEKEEVKFYLVDSDTGEMIVEGINYQEVIQPVVKIARKENGGLIRQWLVEKRLYIDAGPKVFYIISNTSDGIDHLLSKEEE